MLIFYWIRSCESFASGTNIPQIKTMKFYIMFDCCGTACGSGTWDVVYCWGRPPKETGTTTTSPATVHVTSTRRTRWRPRWLDFQLVCLFPKNHDYFTVLRRVYTRLIAAKGSSTQSPCMRTLERRICSWHGLWRRYSTTRKRRKCITNS